MKKRFFVLVLALVSAAAFAQDADVYTSEGLYTAGIEYVGQNCGQQKTDKSISKLKSYPGVYVNTDIKLSQGQWECVQKMLARYKTSRGDTFIIMIAGPNPGGISVVCEFTSDSRYTYWAFHYTLPSGR